MAIDLEHPETPDAIDSLIADLNQATDGVITFERDVLDVDRPEDWGAVELTGTRSEYADGHPIDTTYLLDVWAAVGDRSHEWLRIIEDVFAGYGMRITYRLHERAYLHDVKKILWRWKLELDCVVV